jgi:hypothetical protein
LHRVGEIVGIYMQLGVEVRAQRVVSVSSRATVLAVG